MKCENACFLPRGWRFFFTDFGLVKFEMVGGARLLLLLVRARARVCVRVTLIVTLLLVVCCFYCLTVCWFSLVACFCCLFVCLFFFVLLVFFITNFEMLRLLLVVVAYLIQANENMHRQILPSYMRPTNHLITTTKVCLCSLPPPPYNYVPTTDLIQASESIGDTDRCASKFA